MRRGTGTDLLDAGPLGLSGIVIAGLIAVRVAMLAIAIASPPGAGPTSDAGRFQELASTPGRPWSDFPVEYPPAGLVVVEIVGTGDADAVRDRLAVLAFIGDLATAGALLRGWGRRSAAAYLLLGAPLLTFLYWRVDPFFVAIAVLGVVVGRRRSPAWGGALLAFAAFGRLWPAAILPAIGRRWRSGAWTFAGTAALGTTAWIAYAGWRGPWQVLTAREASGWGADGLVGSVLWLVSGDVRVEQGALRVGAIDPWVSLALGIAIVGVVIWTWSRTATTGSEPAGVPAATAVAWLLVLSPVSSVQFVIWLVPWTAVAASERANRSLVLAVAVAAVIVGAFPFALEVAQDGSHLPLQLVFVGKNAALVIAAAAGVVLLWRTDGASARPPVSQLDQPERRGA